MKMTREQHIAEAERLLSDSRAAGWGAQHDSMVARALVHATLASAMWMDAPA